MTVKVSKPAINVREELADHKKPTGIAGEAMLRAETPQEQFQLINAGRKNLVINGDMRINQRQNLPFTDTSGYTLDRWLCSKNYGGWSISESTGHADEIGHNTATKIDCTSTATMGSTSFAEFQHRIEGSNLQHLQWGGSKGKPVTLSFWVKSNLTGLYSVTFLSGLNLYNASYTIDNPNTWEKKYITIPPLATSVISDGSVSGLILEFWIGLGTSFTDSTKDWGSSPSYGRDGQVNFMSSTDNEWLLTGVQLEVGKVATPFEHRSYGEELALCQRYYVQYELASYQRLAATSYCDINNRTQVDISLPVPLRSYVSAGHTNLTISGQAVNGINLTQTGSNGNILTGNLTCPGTPLTVGTIYQIYAIGAGNFYVNGEL